MKLRIKMQVDGETVYLGRIGTAWVVSDKEDTDEEHAAILETSCEFAGVKETIERFKNYKRNYAHIQPGERSELFG